MKPKLIVLNGPLGIGKTTLAQLYGENHPLTLVLDIDNVWTMISHWREEKDISAPLSKKMAIEMARINLMAGHDVVIPQIVQTEETANDFDRLAEKSEAMLYEILLIVDEEEAIRRFIKRAKSLGHPTGFREGGIIATTGREKKLSQMYRAMLMVAEKRPRTIRIEPILDDIAGTYKKLLEAIDAT